jgi:HlyD family secretion protein
MKKLIVFLVVLAALGSGAWAYYARRTKPEPTITTLPITRGDVADTVQATGTLEAVTTVDVGTQVSGVVQELYADFNSIVRKGQVIARLDPSIIQTQIEQQKANVVRAEAEVERLKVGLQDAEQKFERAKQMMAKELIPRTEFESAELAVKNNDAQIRSAAAGLTQARANLNQVNVNLGYTVITSPIDGIVISRNVDPGQTVASSMNAPTLFVIAADLSKMQVLANIDEADVGRMRPGQHVSFRVDAYPTEQFAGVVDQVRLQPTVVQNVVVYSTVIEVPNPELKLKPGMTANVSIEIARRTNVLRIPTAALRFRPTEMMFTVLNQPVPPEARGGGRGMGGGRDGRGRGGQGGPTAAGGAPADGASQPGTAPPAAQQTKPSQPTPSAIQPATPTPQPGAQASTGRPPSAEARGGGDPADGNRGGDRGGGGRGGFDPNMSPEERRKRMEERLAAMTPEERERFEARRREGFSDGRGGGRGAGPGGENSGTPGGNLAGSKGGNPGSGGGPAAPSTGARSARRDASRGIVGSASAGGAISSGATTIDSLFAPLQIAETPGRVWLHVDKQLKPVRVRTGLSDGTYSELISGELTENQEVVVNMATGLEPRPTTGQGQQTGNPLMGPQRGGPGGGPGRGGAGRGF